jgi:hypothetical protein
MFILFLRNRKLTEIAKNINPKYTGHLNNTFDLFRLLKIYFSNQGSIKDRIFIRDTLLLVCVEYVTFLICLMFILKEF